MAAASKLASMVPGIPKTVTIGSGGILPGIAPERITANNDDWGRDQACSMGTGLDQSLAKISLSEASKGKIHWAEMIDPGWQVGQPASHRYIELNVIQRPSTCRSTEEHFAIPWQDTAFRHAGSIEQHIRQVSQSG